MAKVNNVGLNTDQKIANPFKTSRNSTTNPFKYSNFEGNTLQFADVFEGFEQKKSPSFKGKMISASVAGSMNKLKSLLPESIVNFVNRVREYSSNAWNYAKNTNISDLPGIKSIDNMMKTDIVDIGKGISHSISDMGRGISEKMSFLDTDIVDIGKGISHSISDMGKGISNRMSFLNTDVTEIGRGLSDKWSSLISSVNHKRINKDTPVAELKSMWLDEIALSSNKEVA